MTLTLDSGQATLAARATVACVPIVVVEVFTSKPTKTIGATYYWSRGHPIVYAYDGVNAQAFQPLIQRVTPIARGFDHLPNASVYETRETVEIVLDGSVRVDTYLWKTLLTGNLLGARVTVGSLLYDTEPLAALTSRPNDLSALGAVHVVRWRGEVTAVGSMNDESQTFTLVAESREYTLSSLRRMTNAPRARADSVGKPLPTIIGSVKQVQGLWYCAGISTTLTTAVTTTAQTAWNVGPEFGSFLSWYGTATSTFFGYFLIGQEVVSVTSPVVQGNGTYNVTVVRALAGTTAVLHDVGEVVYEIPSTVELAMHGGSAFSLDGNTVWTRPGVQPVDLSKVTIKGVDLQADITENPGGRLSFLQVDNYRRLINAYNPANVEAFVVALPSSEIAADISGEYTLGSATTRVTMSGDVANWQGLDVQNGATANAVRAATTGGVQFSYTAAPVLGTNYFARTVGPLAIAPVELSFTVNFTAGELANLISLQFGTNLANLIASTYWPTEQICIPASRFVAGDNQVRLNVRVASLTQINLCARFKAFPTNASFRVTGLIESRPMTKVASHPSDVIGYISQTLIANTDIGIDTTSQTQVRTDVPNVTINADIASLGKTLAQVLAQLGFNSRINYLFKEATSNQTQIRSLSATTTYQFPAVSKAIGSRFINLEATPRPISEMGNRFEALYAPIVGVPVNTPDAYSKSLIANEVTNQLTPKVLTSTITGNQTKFGILETAVVPFALLNDATSVLDVMGYYASAALDGQVVRYSCEVPYFIGYDLEPGDIVSIRPRWETADVKCRVTRVVFDFDRNAVGLNLENVL